MSHKIIKLTGLAIFLTISFLFVSESLIRSSSAMPDENGGVIAKAAILSAPEPASQGFPVRLQIPKIRVDAIIESVGLTSQGAVDVPKGPINTAWYNLGPRPGETGSAVITGHYGVWKNGTPTVFNNLSKLRKGDKVYVKDKKGTTLTFSVREIRKYDPSADAQDVFISNDGKAHLNLVTCEGLWNKASKSYPKRLVVFTDKE